MTPPATDARHVAIAAPPSQDDVRQAVAAFLRVDPATLDPQVPLTAYGLDSLGALELVAALEDARALMGEEPAPVLVQFITPVGAWTSACSPSCVVG